MNVPVPELDIPRLYTRYGNHFGDYMKTFVVVYKPELTDIPLHYAVLHRDYAESAPAIQRADFAGFYDGDDGEPLYFLSESAPLKFQIPIIRHEVACRTRRDELGCIDAFPFELALVPSDRLTEYLRRRVEFYRGLSIHSALQVGNEYPTNKIRNGLRWLEEQYNNSFSTQALASDNP